MTALEPSKPQFLPVSFGRASEEIALQIEAAIINGSLSPGERLPSEREMQVQFGKGRAVIREAIKTLKQKGLLEVRKGAKGGAFVRQVEVDNVSESLSLFLKQHDFDAERLIEFRESIDRTITELAISRGTQEEKQELLEQAQQLHAMLSEKDPDFTATGELDRSMNLKLARMAKNPLFEWVMNALQMGFSSHDYALYENPTYREKAAATWIDTAQAIADNEPLRALSYVGHHYNMLRKCVQAENGSLFKPKVPFLQEKSAQGDGE